MPPATAAGRRPAGARQASPRSRRRRGGHADGEEGGSERWLVTYADMLTLLLVLFIVLFSISVLNKSKFISLSDSLASAFGEGPQGPLPGGRAVNDSGADPMAMMPGAPVVPVTGQPARPGPMDAGGRSSSSEAAAAPSTSHAATAGSSARSGAGSAASASPSTAAAGSAAAANLHADVTAEVNKFRHIQAEINRSLDRAGMTGAVQFAIDRRGLVITVVTTALVFPGNSATLLPQGQGLLSVITPPLAEVTNNVEVDGFTNQEKVSTYPYPTGWELSSARASAVVRYLAGHGLANRQLSAVGFSDQRPLFPPDDPRSVTRNRRVEIIVLSSLPAAAGDALQAAAVGH